MDWHQTKNPPPSAVGSMSAATERSVRSVPGTRGPPPERGATDAEHSEREERHARTIARRATSASDILAGPPGSLRAFARLARLAAHRVLAACGCDPARRESGDPLIVERRAGKTHPRDR